MNNGETQKAILCFEKAKTLDESCATDYTDGLLLLGYAYETAGRAEEAAAVFEELYTNVPGCTEAYKGHIRILMNSGLPGDLKKAAGVMKTAYEKTQDYGFLAQRSNLIPMPPEVDLTAGYYESMKYISLKSPQGYDVYYTFDQNAELPEKGFLFTEPILLGEGIFQLRAVNVNEGLVSDELHCLREPERSD